MLRAYVMDFKADWEDHLPLVEFSYSNSFQTSIRIAPFEALYAKKFRSPICRTKLGERKLLGLKIVQLTAGIASRLSYEIGRAHV